MTTATEDNTEQSHAIAAIAKHSWHYDLQLYPLEVIKPNTPLSISYSVLTEIPAYYSSIDGVEALNRHGVTITNGWLTDPQKTAFDSALKAWAAVANITFTNPTNGIGQITIVNAAILGDTRGDTVNAKSPTALDSNSHPIEDINKPVPAGDIFLQSGGDIGVDNHQKVNAGQIGYMTILHEL